MYVAIYCDIRIFAHTTFRNIPWNNTRYNVRIILIWLSSKIVEVFHHDSYMLLFFLFLLKNEITHPSPPPNFQNINISNVSLYKSCNFLWERSFNFLKWVEELKQKASVELQIVFASLSKSFVGFTCLLAWNFLICENVKYSSRVRAVLMPGTRKQKVCWFRVVYLSAFQP